MQSTNFWRVAHHSLRKILQAQRTTYPRVRHPNPNTGEIGTKVLRKAEPRILPPINCSNVATGMSKYGSKGTFEPTTSAAFTGITARSEAEDMAAYAARSGSGGRFL